MEEPMQTMRLTQYVWQAASFAELLDCEISGEEGGWHALELREGLSLLSVTSCSSPGPFAKRCIQGQNVLPTGVATDSMLRSAGLHHDCFHEELSLSTWSTSQGSGEAQDDALESSLQIKGPTQPILWAERLVSAQGSWPSNS